MYLYMSYSLLLNVPCKMTAELKFEMYWLRLVGSLKLQVSFAKEPFKRDYILQKRYFILRSLLIVATPYQISLWHSSMNWSHFSKVSFLVVCSSELTSESTRVTNMRDDSELEQISLWQISRILQVSFAKEPNKRDCILQKRPITLSILLTIATPYQICTSRVTRIHMGWLRLVGSLKF